MRSHPCGSDETSLLILSATREADAKRPGTWSGPFYHFVRVNRPETTIRAAWALVVRTELQARSRSLRFRLRALQRSRQALARLQVPARLQLLPVAARLLPARPRPLPASPEPLVQPESHLTVLRSARRQAQLRRLLQWPVQQALQPEHQQLPQRFLRALQVAQSLTCHLRQTQLPLRRSPHLRLPHQPKHRHRSSQTQRLLRHRFVGLCSTWACAAAAAASAKHDDDNNNNNNSGGGGGGGDGDWT